MCQDRNVTMFQDRNARMFRGRFQDKSVRMSLVSNAIQFLVSSVKMFPARSVIMFPSSSVMMFPVRSVDRFRGNNAQQLSQSMENNPGLRNFVIFYLMSIKQEHYYCICYLLLFIAK